MKINELYSSVTARIIADMEAGVVPWTRPWKSPKHQQGSLLPHNRATGRCYNGINIPILWMNASIYDYPTAEWMTYQQAVMHGGQVRAGERSCQIVFTKQLTVKENEEEKRFGMLKTYNVFNVAQIDHLEAQQPLPVLTEPERHAKAEAFLEATGARITYGGDRAYYVGLPIDGITIPALVNFKTVESFYATAFHECVHWSGAKHRLDREMIGKYGSKEYGFEELVAELGAAFLCAHLGISGELRHADYIANWLKVLKDDDRAIFKAASLASKASNYLRAFSEETSNADD